MAGEACMQTFGGYAFAEEYDIERKWRETRLYQVLCFGRVKVWRRSVGADRGSSPRLISGDQIAPISTNMILAYLSEHVLGLPKSY